MMQKIIIKFIIKIKLNKKNKILMSKNPESCIGDLIKDINEEIPPDTFHNPPKDIISKSSLEQKISLNTILSYQTISTASSSLNYKITKPIILSAFNNQNDTIYLQKMLMEASKETLSQIIKEISGTFSMIIKNKNGNYFCSDLFKVCDENQRIIILKEISMTLCYDCLDEFGTHSIQTLIEYSSTEEEYKIILSCFNDCSKIAKAAISSNGFYVVQKIINHIPENIRMEFNYLFLKLFYQLSLDIYGISTVKTFIFHTKNEDILNQIGIITYNHFLEIAKNKYGNYLIQCMLEHWGNSKPGIKLKKMCIAYFGELMENHYSKYICDLFIDRANIEEKKIVLAILLKNKHNFNIFNTNKDKGNIPANNNTNTNTNNINTNNNNFYIPLSNNAKPFYPKNKKQSNAK